MTVELHTLTGAYAAHALNPQEQAEFEAHLGDCTDCRQETRELIATTARIGAAEDVPPPPELKARVMAEIARTRQFPPLGGDQAPVVELGGRRRNRLTLAVAAAVVALAVIGGGITGGIALHERQQNHQVEANSAAIASVLSAPDARTVVANGPDGSRGTAVVSDSRHSAVFSAAGWPAPPAGKAYQLWVIDASGAHSQGLLNRSAEGLVKPVVSRDIAAPGASFGVTLEPAGGSKQPTTTPVLLMPIHA
jgi:anti-sigma-K factor RskA